LVSPDTVALRAEAGTVVDCPPDEVTVYEVMALPPSETGGVQVTVAEVSPAVADTPVGVPGGVAGKTGRTGVTDEEAELAGPVPTALVAVTVNV